MAPRWDLLAWVLNNRVLNGGRCGEWSQLCARSMVVLRISGGAILLTAVGFNLFGDGIRDLLTRKQEESSHDPTRSGHSTADLSFPGFNGDVHALNNVSLQLTAVKLSVWWENPARVNQSLNVDYASVTDGQLLRTSGTYSLLGEDVLNAQEKQLRQWRGHEWR